jgi:hypothetical protein
MAIDTNNPTQRNLWRVLFWVLLARFLPRRMKYWCYDRSGLDPRRFA